MDRLVFAIYRLAAVVLGALPIELVFRIGSALGTLGYYVAAPYRRLVLRNLTIAFGEEKSPGELHAIAREHFAALGANLFSSIKIPRMPREEIAKLVAIEGLEIIEALNRAGRGNILVLSHIGNWELLAQITAIAFGRPVGTIFQALGNPHLDAEVRRNRATLGAALFERKEGFQGAMKMAREGGCVGVLIDQHAGDAGVWCPFFGRLASTSSLAAMLALRTGAALIPAAVYTAGVGRWRMVIEPEIVLAARAPELVTAQMNTTLEAQIRRRPSDWFWVHNRWKTPKPKFLLATYKRGVVTPPGVAAERELQPFRILIRASNWLGDAVMSVPAVRAIKRGRIDACVSVLTPAKLADFWKSIAEVDEVIAIEPVENTFAVAKKICRNFEVAILFPNSFRAAFEVWLAGVPRRVGRPGHYRKSLLNQVFEPKRKKSELHAPAHQTRDYLEIAEFIGADITETAALPLATRHSPSVTPVIGLCPGAEYGPAKRWLPERFAETMQAVRERTGCEWRIFGVENDRAIGDEIVAQAAIPCTNCIGKTTLAQLMDELAQCDALLTNDTGTMHLAAHLGVPVIALFGSTEPTLTGPLGANHRVLRHHVECSPCFLRQCPIDFRCMGAIEVREVVATVLAVLEDS